MVCKPLSATRRLAVEAAADILAPRERAADSHPGAEAAGNRLAAVAAGNRLAAVAAVTAGGGGGGR